MENSQKNFPFETSFSQNFWDFRAIVYKRLPLIFCHTQFLQEVWGGAAFSGYLRRSDSSLARGLWLFSSWVWRGDSGAGGFWFTLGPGMSHWWAPGSRGPMWGLASANMSPSTQKDRANVWESQLRHPLHLLPSFKALSLSRLTLLLLFLLLHIRASLSVAASLSRAHIIPRPPISSSSRLFSCPSAAAAAASWCCSHFSSPEAHSWVRGNVWLYLYGASFLLDSYCFGTEVPHSKFIKGQFNSKFMKWASVKVPAPMCFVCFQGASATPVPFPSLIRNYWVDSFLFNTKNLFPLHPHNWNIRQPNAATSFQPEKQRGDGDG